jgi:hypothetical protein
MKAKPIILVIITLLIGFVLGMLTSAQIRFNKLKPVRLYFSEDRFREGLYKTIEPDEKQKAEIEKILDKYATLNSELQANLRKGLESNMKELRKELDSKLTKEQLARLKAMDEQRQEMIRQSWRNHRNDTADARNFRRGDHGGRPFPESRQMPPPGRPPYDSSEVVQRLPDNK